MSDGWTTPMRNNVETGETQALVPKHGVVEGHIVECWVAPGPVAETPLVTLPEDEE